MSVAAKSPLNISRYFTKKGVNPFDMIEWEKRTAQITDSDGNIIFEQKDVETPKTWSATATNIVASKYLHGKLGTPERESGIRALIDRVVMTITNSAVAQGYLTIDGGVVFAAELRFILATQRASFNSPVWFNVGCDLLEPAAEAGSWHWDETTQEVVYANTGYRHPQCSACFINAVDDSMEGIMNLARTEALLFKFGSGTGTNFSSLRSSLESVSGGGVASGPLSFMKGLDAFAGVIKSGGKTRRAAKMAILNVTHPDIEAFIRCKQKEEAKAYALMREGYDGSSGPDSEAYASIFYQNANNSVRVTDEFMAAVEADAQWELVGVTTGQVCATISAKKLMSLISEAAWACGDPGMQYDTTINKWHTSKNTDRINASNPCSEYMFLDDSACNLASLNLMKFLRKNGTFEIDAYRHTVDIMIIAMDVIIDMAGYPTEQIARNSHDYRPLGLGYANLGALLMALGLAYDSDAGRGVAAGITSLMCGEAYLQSARMSRDLKALKPATAFIKSKQSPGCVSTGGFCPGWLANEEPFKEVVRMHQAASLNIQDCPEELKEAADKAWEEAVTLGTFSGFRNAQVTVLAPTGTIGFMMDCDTTGVEPELGLVKYKKLVGGGMLKIVNETVSRALSRLGYKDPLISTIVDYIDQTGTVEGSGLAPAHLPVFDCSFKPVNGSRSIRYTGHLMMMAATQPFLSGAISKTINMPEEATVEDVQGAFMLGHELGLKAVAIYRDGSKKNQVLVTRKDELVSHGEPSEDQDLSSPPRAIRHKLPDERQAIIHKFAIAGHEGYIHVGLYPSGVPGEIFVTTAKEGSTISGLLDSFAIMTSLALQHGVHLRTIVDKLAHTRFEPSGFTTNQDIKYAKSIMDYIARYLEARFLKGEQQMLFPADPVPVAAPAPEPDEPPSMSNMIVMGDSPSCSICGSIMIRNGSCYKCSNCGGTSGCS